MGVPRETSQAPPINSTTHQLNRSPHGVGPDRTGPQTVVCPWRTIKSNAPTPPREPALSHRPYRAENRQREMSCDQAGYRLCCSWMRRRRKRGATRSTALTAALLFVLCVLCQFEVGSGSCQGGGRTVLTSPTGVLSDGRANYPQNTECQWLIQASNSSQAICIQFSSFETECTYDFLHVFDGDAFSSPRLGSFSGSKIPPRLCATSGKMLVYLYSDTNYPLDGFELNYTISDCPLNCGGRGSCLGHRCQCSAGYHGNSCQFRNCPAECGAHGTCRYDRLRPQCVCQPGYIGEGCGLATDSNEGWGNMFLLSSGGGPGFSPRTGHAAVYHAGSDEMFVFGGYDLTSVLGDLVKYSFQVNAWEPVLGTGGPAGRYAHTMDLHNDSLFVVGGILADGAFSDDLWSFNVALQQWSQLASLPTPLAHHASCVVDDRHLYIIGGRSDTSSFLHHIYRYDLTVHSGWEAVDLAGGLPDWIGVAEHSSVYHPPTRSIYVFGGIREQNIKFGMRSKAIYTFNVDKRLWLKLEVEGELPRGRTYHTAAVIGQHYMVVYGGNTHTHRQAVGGPLSAGNEDCYEDSIHLYHFGCNAWVDYNSIAHDFTAERAKSLDRGRFGHTAVVRDGTTLVIAGGFRGLVIDDVIAIKMPGTVAVNPAMVAGNRTAHSEDTCTYHTSVMVCQQDLECGYCQTSSSCINKALEQDCPNFLYGSCPGFCAQASTCQACLSLEGSSALEAQCGWCVQTRTCHSYTDIESECASFSGWWGDRPTIIKNFGQCRLKDFPSGLTLVTYYRPYRADHPDKVEVIEDMHQEFNDQSALVREARWTLEGLFYPLDAIPSKQESALRVYLRSTNADTTLWMSQSDTAQDAVQVVYLSSPSGEAVEAIRPDGTPLIPDPSSRYYIRLEAAVDVETKPSILELTWNGNAVDRERIPSEHLRPFASGDCGIHRNCHSCLKDALCGWCPRNGTCELRNATNLPAERCGSVGVGLLKHHLTLVQDYCPSCGFHLDCDTCVESPYCEWREAKKGFCSWRGSGLDTAVTEVGWCSDSCYERSGCGDCVAQEGCAWCESDRRCFPFKHYVKTYSYGQCTHWFDEVNPCPDCSAHRDCHQCLREFQCGWCGNREIPLYGVCTQGDFSGPSSSDQNCSSLVAQNRPDLSPSEPADWSYGECPGTDECAKGLVRCHPNASCYDTYLGYECKCDRGFKGDGNITCSRTCLDECIHGVCTESPDYVCRCDLGWTGPSCNVDCGCNLHSSCSQGVGICDQCHNRTVGDRCDRCQPGSFGDPLSRDGCHPCDCNGHGDPTRGYCDSDSQRCHCIHNTVGDFCDRCAEGFYGDPQTEGCFLECSGRAVRWGERRVSLGSLAGEGVADPLRANCLWILSPFQSEAFAANTSLRGTIQLTITSVNTTCGRDYVQVYDGVPESVWGQSNASSELLGNFCGHGEMEPLTVTAHSGFVTVIFRAVLKGPYRWTGFTALYKFISCDEEGGCGENRTCVDRACVCDSEHRGERCDQDACPENCHESSSQGSCNQATGVCHCSPGYGGISCEHHTLAATATRGVWTHLEGGSTPPGRVGHSMFKRSDNQLVIFGGFSNEAGFLNDMWRFDATDGSWHEVLYVNRGPSGRYFHGTVYLPSRKELFVYGGLTEEGASRELWVYNTSSRLWYQKQADSPQDPPPLAGLTLTAHHRSKFLLVGGYSPPRSFYPELKEYNAELGQWAPRVPKGIAPIGIYGHVAVWHEGSGALYVFGGYRFARAQVWSSDVLYSYRLSTNTWNILPPATNYAPSSHLFHTGFTTSRYLVIIGGGTPEQNFTSSVHAYQYDCNTWQVVKTTEDGPPPAFGQTVVDIGETSYVYGGFAGSARRALYSLTLPDDLCRQYQSQAECKAAPGCTSCMYNGTFLSCTYRNGCSPNVESPTSVTDSVNGSIVECNTTSVPTKSCRDHKTCGECLAAYPAHSSSKGATKMGCKWCRGCEEVTCIPRTEACQNYCPNNEFEDTTDINRCAELICPVPACEDCLTMRGCMWTRQIQPVEDSETKFRLAQVPAYSWNCFSNRLISVSPVDHETESSPPLPCPSQCHTHTTCGDCQESDGADGGWSTCVWSSNFQQCMSPSFLYLLCTTGRCGLIIYDKSRELCPVPCGAITRCDSCLKQAECGWCSVGSNYTGGVCMEGSKASPTYGVCQDRTITGKMFITDEVMQLAEERTEWYYLTCPPENECANGEHNCGENERCVDTQESYRCECKAGYRNDGEGCVPICSEGCEHGTCVAPGTCECDFGYVGADCVLQCQCNNHSACTGPEDLGACTSCVGNTTGRHCELCQTFNVGNASAGGQCLPCSTVCHGNTDFCVSRKDYDNEVSPWEGRPGPLPDDVICLNCSNNSDGPRCESCQDGFFMLDHRCQPCRCNGHSDTCNKRTGTECHCSNHTKSPACPEGNQMTPCYEYQCSECTEKDVFKGTPTNGHQCYRQVDVSSMRCFGESINMKCSSGSPLPPGKSELFVIKPAYVDLDIRVTIDVTEGGVDVYIAHEPDMFVVDSHRGVHTVLIDASKEVDQTDLIPVDGSRPRWRREVDKSVSAEDTTNRVISHDASGLNTFVTVDNSHFVMVIRNLQNRMVVTFPHTVHNFEKKWFYLILHAQAGSPRNDTPGALVYKQDVPEIDLFIFFSAFLSSFFKLLAILIAIWKLKVSWEARQAARARSVEMENRRSRPFGRVVVYMEGLADPLPPLPAHPSRRTKRSKSPKHRKERSSGSTAALRNRQGVTPMPHGQSAVPPGVPTPQAHVPVAEATEERVQFSPGPISLEPTEDGLAAVGTVVIALPGGKMAPLQACLGSGLVRQGKCNTVPPNQTRMARHGVGNSGKQGNMRQSSGRIYRPV